jgi:MFS family permease
LGLHLFLLLAEEPEIIMEEKAIYNWIVIFHDFLRKLWICSFTRTINFHEILPGISAGLMSPQVLSYIQILFPEHKERTYALGCYGIAIGIGTMLGQFLGGFLVELKPVFVDQSWRYIFLINIPICVINIFLAVFFLKNSADTFVQHIDYKSTFILCIALILSLFSITIGLEYSVIITFITLSFSILLWIYFIKSQKRKVRKIVRF